MQSSPLLLFLCCCLSATQGNRVYIHPFNLFSFGQAECETLQTQPSQAPRTAPARPLDAAVLTPDARDGPEPEAQNITQRTQVLAELSNILGLRTYLALSRKLPNTNSLVSPVNIYGSLVTLYQGVSRRTARPYLGLLGLSNDLDREDCVSLVDGHKVLKTLQSISSLVDDDSPKISTQVWAVTRGGVELSQDFVERTKDFSDTSFTRSLDFSKPHEAQRVINEFVENTSGGKLKSVFTGLNSSTDFLFLTSFNFQGNWRTAFQPDSTSQQEFHVDDTTTVMAQLMTSTGQFHFLNDKVRRCTVVRLPLSKRTYMLLVLPHEGVQLRDIESTLPLNVMSDWLQNLQEGLLELSLPKFSLSSVSDLRELLTHINPEIEAKLLGSEAEFSQLSNVQPFGVDKALHKVLFEMSEDGAEHQDKTPTTGIPLKLTVNRPFLFSIVEADSNAILMLGKITNPTL